MIPSSAHKARGAYSFRWMALLLSALLSSWAASQDESNADDAVLTTQIISIVAPVNAQAEVRDADSDAGGGKTVALGTPTDRLNQSSRSSATKIGMVYSANPELREVVPGDFVSFEALNGDTFGFQVTGSRVTRYGNVEIIAQEGDTSLFAVVSETGDFFADVQTGNRAYRAFISEGQTVVFAADDPEISRGIIANDTPFNDFEALKRQFNSLAQAEQLQASNASSSTTIALGILLDNYLWGREDKVSMVEYYVYYLNNAYQQAGVNIRFEISQIANFQPYIQAGAENLYPTLSYITCGSSDCSPTSGVNSAVDNWRVANKLDVVSQFMTYAAVSATNAQGQYQVNWGIAQLPFSDVNLNSAAILKQYTYSVIGVFDPNSGSTAGSYLLAHEVGHNFGLWHDRATLESQLEDSWANLQPFLQSAMRYPYGLGYRFGQSSGTTMSYAPTNINILSTPNVTSGGVPIGVPVGQSNQAFSAQAVGNVMAYYKAVFNNAPAAPTVTKVEGEDGKIFVSFTPGATGGLAVTAYTATCTDGQNTFQGAGTSSPIAVDGVPNDVAYTCTVIATNPDGVSASSGPSAPVTPEESAGGLPIWLLYEATK